MATRMSPTSRSLVLTWTGAVLAVVVLGGGFRVAHSGAAATPTAKMSEGKSVSGEEPTVMAAASKEVEKSVAGQVLDPDGKPVAGATVAVVGRSRSPSPGGNLTHFVALGVTKTDDQGHFSLGVPTSRRRPFSAFPPSLRPRLRCGLGAGGVGR